MFGFALAPVPDVRIARAHRESRRAGRFRETLLPHQSSTGGGAVSLGRSHMRRQASSAWLPRWEKSSRRTAPMPTKETAGCWEDGGGWLRFERASLERQVGHPTFASAGCGRIGAPVRSRLLSGACTSRVPDGCCFRDRAGSVSATMASEPVAPRCASASLLFGLGGGDGQGASRRHRRGQRWTGALTVRFAHAGAAVARRRPRFPRCVEG